MPCSSNYMEATNKEVLLSQVACLLDELNGKPSIDKGHWNGYHPRIYNQGFINEDELVAELCEKLQSQDVTKLSLEMQIWWRDHQEADRQRLAQEVNAAVEKEEIEKVLAKLTTYEKELLGIKVNKVGNDD